MPALEVSRNRQAVLQIRYRDDALRVTCNQYLHAFPAEFYRVVVFLSGSDDPDVRKTVQADEVIFLDLSRRQLKGLRRYARKQIARIISRINPTLIIAHRWKATTIAVAAVKDVGIRNLMVFSVVHALNQLRTISRRLVGRFFLKGNCHFIGVSAAVAADLLNSGFGLGAEDVLALSNAVDIESTLATLPSRSKARRQLNLPADIPLIGHVGRLVRAKDQKTLIAAFARLLPKLPAARLLIVGDGYLEEELKTQVKSLALPEGAIIFAGALNNAVSLMPAFDLFVLTSVTEGFPRVLLEALLCQIPIVATDAGGIREVLGEEAQLCRPGDIDGVAAAIEMTLELDEEKLKKIGEDGRQRVRDNFSSEIFQRRLLAFVLD